MKDVFDFSSYSPSQIAQKVEQVGVVKAGLPALPLLMLGIVAGAFISLGGLCFILVKSDPTLGFAASQVLGGLAFSLGLILITVAGAELFTGNNLLVMAWADGRISMTKLLRNWMIVLLGNLIGTLALALLVVLSGHTEFNGGKIAQTYIAVAQSKASLDIGSAFFRGVLCNILVCMAVWMALAGQSVTDKILAIVFPITAFVAAGFEHSVANLYFFPVAMMIAPPEQAISTGAALGNLLPVLAGNIVGGAVLVALVYHVIYRHQRE